MTLLATHDGHDAEIVSHPHDQAGTVWSVTVDGDGTPERFVDLDDAKAAAEAKVGARLKWEEA